MIRPITSADSIEILKIYRLGLETRNATFETIVPTWDEWETKFHRHSRFAYITENRIVGWTAIAPYSKRKVYKGVAEVSIYVHPKFTGKGIGSLLMKQLIGSSEKHGIWTLFSSVFPENKATIQLHIKFGFKLLGRRDKIAKLDGTWRDTLIFERRSEITGIEEKLI